MGSDVPRTIEDVQNDDAAFRAREAEGPAVVPEVEGAELKRLLADARVCERCVSVAVATVVTGLYVRARVQIAQGYARPKMRKYRS